MPDRPYTTLSSSVSLDGYLGDRTPRLVLSNEAGFDRVDAVRASCDAIMVGAVTARTDDPRLLVRSQARRDEGKARGLASSPMKITVSDRVDLDARSNFFTAGEAEKLVYFSSSRVPDARVVHTLFLADDLVDELQLVVAPFFVGDSSAARFVSEGRFGWNAQRRATLAEVRPIGDVVLLRYALSPRFRDG